MSDILAVYGAIADLNVSPTVQAGRYPFQDEAERRIIHDVVAKLGIGPQHRVLDIGCGAGLLLVPLSHMAREVVGLDHPATVAALRRRFPVECMDLIGGGFPETAIPGSFDRIVSYSVTHCLSDLAEVERFILAAADLLNAGGRLLIGDMPNRDRAARYRASDAGREGEAAWAEMKAMHGDDPAFREAAAGFGVVPQLGGFSDADLCGLMLTMRRNGYEAYITSQPADLPFGHTREDLVVIRN